MSGFFGAKGSQQDVQLIGLGTMLPGISAEWLQIQPLVGAWNSFHLVGFSDGS